MIPFNQARLIPGTYERIEEAFRGKHVSGNGPFARLCEEQLRELTAAVREYSF